MKEMKLTRKEEKVVEKEVRKRLRDRLRGHAGRFGREFKKHVVVAVSAALGFLVALSWREPIKNSVDLLIENLGIGNEVYFKFLSAIFVTLIAVLVLMLVARWRSEK